MLAAPSHYAAVEAMVPTGPVRARDSLAPTPIRRAFTFVELLIVLVIVGMLAGIAAPRYANFLAREHVEAAAHRIATDIALAQRRAKFSSTSMTLTFDPASECYTLIGVQHPDHPSQPYTVDLNGDPYRSLIESADFGGDAELIFDGYGIPDSTGTIVVKSGTWQRTIKVDALTGAVTISEGGTPNPPQLPL